MKIYWSTWIISLFVTMCNGLQALFKLDKKYYSIHTTLEQLISEGWQFIELTAKYSGFYTSGMKPTHDNQFIFFCYAVEKIRMRQIEEEYYKMTEMSHSGSSSESGAAAAAAAAAAAKGGATAKVAPLEGVAAAAAAPAPVNEIVAAAAARLPAVSLIPQTPLKDELTRLPADILKAVQEQLSRAQVDGGTAPRRNSLTSTWLPGASHTTITGGTAQASPPFKKESSIVTGSSGSIPPKDTQSEENGEGGPMSV